MAIHDTGGAEAGSATPEDFGGYERLVVMLLGFLQFTVILDFLVLAPLGAVIMPTLGINAAQFGMLVSSYAFSACVSGVVLTLLQMKAINTMVFGKGREGEAAGESVA